MDAIRAARLPPRRTAISADRLRAPPVKERAEVVAELAFPAGIAAEDAAVVLAEEEIAPAVVGDALVASEVATAELWADDTAELIKEAEEPEIAEVVDVLDRVEVEEAAPDAEAVVCEVLDVAEVAADELVADDAAEEDVVELCDDVVV
ncbi:MAG: hypothetical protein M1829_000671 [Trizodia sp. TS-e1964]|nr:MAG: hypothetical protein M1829_000671 [Trizodia sp. TS-e1964]